MTEAEKAYQYFVIAVPENEEQAKAYFWVRKALQSTLTPQNEWVKRMLELDELYTKLQVVTGFTAERLLEMFADGYTLEKPDYAKSFEDMASLAETTPQNEALMLGELREMDGEPVYVVPANKYSEIGKWCVISIGDSDDYSCALVPGVEYWTWKFEGYGEQWLAYRRPPEGEEEQDG